MEHFGEVPAVPGHGESIQQRALQIRYQYADLTDPLLPAAEEAIRLDLDESVQRISCQETAPGPRRPALLRAGDPGVRCGKDEHVPRYLLCQPVMVQSRPVGDHGWRDEGCGDFEVFKIAHENLQQEAGYRALLQALFLLMAVPTQSEKPNWGGRADHEVHICDRVYVFEVKYNQSEGDALRQIRDRGYGREHLRTGHTVTAVGLAFRRDLKTGPCLKVAQADLAALLEAREEGEDDSLRDSPVPHMLL